MGDDIVYLELDRVPFGDHQLTLQLSDEDLSVQGLAETMDLVHPDGRDIERVH